MADHIQIGDISPRIQYTGDGSQTVFTYPFPIFADADMAAFEDTTLQTLTTHYTVSGAGNSSGGSVTFITAPANGVTVTLKRQLAIQRTSDFQESGEFRSKVINDELDTLTAALQQVDDGVSRSLRLSATDSANSLTLPDKATRSSKFLGFDANGDPVVTDAAGPAGPTGPAGNMDGSNNLSELTNVGTARTTLGLGSAAVEDVAAGGSGDLLRDDGDGSGLTGITTSDDVARANIMLNAFRIAVNGGISVQNMVDGVVDEFEDETGVDTGGSTNAYYKAAGNFYQGTGVTSPTVVTSTASMWTSDTSEFTFSGDDILYLGATAVNGIRTVNAVVGDFEIQFTQTAFISTSSHGMFDASELASYDSNQVSGRSNMENMANSWYVADGGGGEDTYYQNTKQSDETMVDGSVIKWKRTGSTIEIYDDAVLAHTWTQTSNADIHFAIATGQLNRIDFDDFSITYSAFGGDDMVLVSNATTALATPSEAFIAIWQEDVAVITLNTDLKAYASRDGGTTWDLIPLTEEASLSTGRILTGSVALTSSGTSMKYKIETLNAKEQRIHGVGLQWS